MAKLVADTPLRRFGRVTYCPIETRTASAVPQPPNHSGRGPAAPELYQTLVEADRWPDILPKPHAVEPQIVLPALRPA